MSNISEDNNFKDLKGAPRFVTAQELVNKGFIKDWNYYFNQDGNQPLTIGPGDPINIRWPGMEGNEDDQNLYEVTPIRFSVPLSKENPVRLLMDIIPFKPGRKGQIDMDFRARVYDRDAEQLSFGFESDYSFLRTPPLWEQKLSENMLELPSMKIGRPNNNAKPHEKAFLDNPRGLIVVTKNASGRGNPDLRRKAFVIQLIAEELGSGRHLLVNRANTDRQYLKAVADKNGMDYIVQAEGDQTMPKA